MSVAGDPRLLVRPAPIALVWVPCATCWGQRQIIVQATDGRDYTTTCWTCRGIGEQLVRA